MMCHVTAGIHTSVFVLFCFFVGVGGWQITLTSGKKNKNTHLHVFRGLNCQRCRSSRLHDVVIFVPENTEKLLLFIFVS